MKVQQPPLTKLDPIFQAWLVQLVKVVNSAVVIPAPVNSTDPGEPGQIAYDASFFYICVAPNTWLRVAVSTW